MKSLSSLPLLTLVLGLALSQTACLKTRAQLRGDGTDGDEPAQTQGPTPVRQGAGQGADPHAGGGYAIDEMKSEITRLNGRIEDMERASKSSAASSDEYKKLETRVTELEQAQVNILEAFKKMQDAAPSSADTADLFKKGKNQVEAGNIEGSIETFTACLKATKNKHAEDCTFARAESHYALREYKKAIVDYSKFPEKFTKSSYMPKALYRIGLSFEALGMKDDAKGFYQELVEKHPKSPEAKKARSKAK